MKNYVIVAIIIILIIVGVVWFKMKSPAPVVPNETTVTTEPAPVDTGAPVDASGTPVDTGAPVDASGTPVTQ